MIWKNSDKGCGSGFTRSGSGSRSLTQFGSGSRFFFRFIKKKIEKRLRKVEKSVKGRKN